MKKKFIDVREIINSDLLLKIKINLLISNIPVKRTSKGKNLFNFRFDK